MSPPARRTLRHRGLLGTEVPPDTEPDATPALGDRELRHELGVFLRDVGRATIDADDAAWKRLQQRASGMQQGVGSDGGFAMPQELAQRFVASLFGQGEILRRVNLIVAQTNTSFIVEPDETTRANGGRRGGLRHEWIAEAGTPTPSKIKVRQADHSKSKIAVVGFCTTESLDDSAFLDVLVQCFLEEEVFGVELGIFSGDGAGEPLGIIKSNALVQQAIEGTQTIGNTPQFIAANVSKMAARMPMRCYARAVWLMQRNLYLSLCTATTGANGPTPAIFTPAWDPEAPWGRILGRPILPHEYAPAVGAVGDLVLADLLSYDFSVRTPEPKQALSPHVRFLHDEQVFKMTWRVQGAPAWPGPVTPFDGGDPQSTFVALAARGA